MAGTQTLASMSEPELLAYGEEQERAARVAECNKILFAQAWAAANPGQCLQPAKDDSADKPGRERARQLGAAGTPTVAEFAPATLGARLRISAHAGARLMADAIDIRHRLPNIQGLVETGEADARRARYVAQQTRELSAAEAALVDEHLVVVVAGSISWRRFELVVAAAVLNAAPELARRRALAAHRPTFTRIPGMEHDGSAALLARGDVASITQIQESVNAHAETLPPLSEAETIGERRIRALVDLTAGGPSNPPQVQLHVHTFADDPTDPDGEVPPIARVEGHGPVSTAWLSGLLGAKATFTVRPVLDIPGLAPVDAYEIPHRHRRAVRMITPADTFPWANCLSDRMDIDHTEPWKPDGPPGQSRIGNYGPMTRHHHRIKTHGRWEVKQPFAGIYLWRDPAGAIYLVDATGTRRLSAAG